ncbi:MAG: hypothetical protein IJU23_04030 [Proteobacteria bacterium]|nr:hypothetical protein [Pseudomonadota bacterium]
MKTQTIYCFFTAILILLIPLATSCDEDCDYNHDYCTSLDAEHGGSDHDNKSSSKTCSTARDCQSGYVCRGGICKKS